jgi:redox-sensitive bicupin YhaK (pirin superfamily)
MTHKERVGVGSGTAGSRVEIRRAGQRFHTRTHWLNSYHSFSFGHHYDPENVGFGTLRVLNDDVIAPGQGFGEHPHQDMEIVTWVLKGALAHRDSSGGEGVLRPGEAQAMTAGTGIVHSEYNASTTEPVHLLQMWIEPARAGLPPGYTQKSFPETEYRGKLLPVVSDGSIDGTLAIHQRAVMWVGSLEAGQRVTHRPAVGERSHLYLASGRVRLGEETLTAGDSARITGKEEWSLQVEEPADLVVWDLD